MKRLRPLFELPLLPVCLASAAMMAPTCLTLRALFWGTPLLQFIPWWAWAWKTLLQGHLPLWNPDLGMGAPLLANYQSALFYPPTWTYFLLYLIGGIKLMAWGQAPMVALHLAWAGIGMALLARRLALGVLAQAVAGLAYGLCGYLVSRAGFLSINAAAAWLPWILWALTPARGVDFPSWRRLLLLSFLITMQLLAGHAQTTWYSLLLAGLWATYWTLAPGKGASIRRLGLAWGWLALAGFLAACLAAVQLLPTAEYLAQSSRAAAVDYDFAMNYSFWPWHLLTLLAPEMFGNPAWGDYWGYANYWEDAVYVGLLPFLLALGVLFGVLWRAFRKNDPSPPEDARAAMQPRFAGFLALIFILAFLLALGRFAPIFPLLYRYVPTFDMFQAPARWMLWAEFSLAVLAGIGAERWRRPVRRGLYWTRLGSMGAFAVSLGAGMTWFLMREISPTFIRATALAGFWGLGAGLLSLTAPPDDTQAQPAGEEGLRSYPWWPWAVTAWVALDLLIAGWGLNPATDLDLYSPAPGAAKIRGFFGAGRIYMPTMHEYAFKYERFLRFDTFYPGHDWQDLRSSMLANANLLDGVSSANNFDPLTPGRYITWMEILDRAAPGASWQMLDMMNVSAVILFDEGSPSGTHFQAFQSAGRARWVPCANLAPDSQAAWQAVSAGLLDYRQEVILEAPRSPVFLQCDPHQALGAPAQAQHVQVALQDEGPHRVTIAVDAPAEGWLVLADTWYPGWTARVDDLPQAIIPANGLFRAVYVGPGAHRITFSYRPLSFYAGAVISALAFLTWLLLWRHLKKGEEKQADG